MSQEALDALKQPGDQAADPVIRAARILADAIDRLNVALTGTTKDESGTLGWAARALGVIAHTTFERGSGKSPALPT